MRSKEIIRSIRKDIEVVMYRGNVDKRMRKIDEGEVDGNLIECEGLRRIGIEDVIKDVIDK